MPASGPRSRGARVHPRSYQGFTSLGWERVRPLAWCSRPRSSAASLAGALGRAVLDEALLECVAGGLGPVRDFELAVDVRQVELDGLLGDPELLCDRLVRQASRHGAHDDELALGQPRLLRRALSWVV